MQSRSVRTAAVAAALSALLGTTLAGCGGDSADAGGSSSSSAGTPAATSSSAAPSSSAATTTAASPTSTELGPGLPGVPANARANTEAAAIAFAKHYFARLNDLRQHPVAGVIDKYALPGCKSCAGFAGHVAKLAQDGRRNTGPFVRVKNGTRITGESGMAIAVELDQLPVETVDRGGSTTGRLKSAPGMRAIEFLTWTSGGWRVKEIQLDKSSVQSARG